MKTKRKRTVLIICLLLAIILPLLGGFAAKPLFNRTILNKPDFWYGYMAYFGTVALACVALYQSIKADEANKRILKQQLYQKIGYLNVSNDKNGELINGIARVKYDGQSCTTVIIGVKNVGEDIIRNPSIESAEVNKIKASADCKIGTIFIGEGFLVNLSMPESIDSPEIDITLRMVFYNTANMCYRQEIHLIASELDKQMKGVYYADLFTTEIIFPED